MLNKKVSGWGRGAKEQKKRVLQGNIRKSGGVRLKDGRIPFKERGEKKG